MTISCDSFLDTMLLVFFNYIQIVQITYLKTYLQTVQMFAFKTQVLSKIHDSNSIKKYGPVGWFRTKYH